MRPYGQRGGEDGEECSDEHLTPPRRRWKMACRVVSRGRRSTGEVKKGRIAEEL